MLDFNKIRELYLDLSKSSFFEEETAETQYIEAELQNFFLQKEHQYSSLSDLDAAVDYCVKYVNKQIHEPNFTDLQIKALGLVADAALGNSVPHPKESEQSIVPLITKKGIRGRKKKTKVEKVQPVIGDVATKSIEDDEWIDSEIPMRDPQTGHQMIDPKTGKPLFLRRQKNPPKMVIPANYKPPPPPSMANAIVEQQAMQDLQKAQNFKVGGGFTLADIINKSKG